MSCDICSMNHIQRRSQDLYHVKQTVEHISYDPNAQIYKTDILGTFTDLPVAKKAAYSALQPQETSFKIFESKQRFDPTTWPYDDSIFVRAVAESGDVSKISIETDPNNAGLMGNTHGEVCGPLYYVLQEVIHYADDRDGCKRETFIEGTFKIRADARECAKNVLTSENTSEQDFEVFEVFSEEDDCTYGKDAVVHAVAANGENFLVSVVEGDKREGN